MPKALRARIKAAAELERRDLSPWLVIQLEELLDARDKALEESQAAPEPQKQPSRQLKAKERAAKPEGSGVAERR